MAVQKEIKTKTKAVVEEHAAGWIEGIDEKGEVIFVRSTVFDELKDTEEAGRVVPRVEMIRRFGRAGIKQKVSL